MQNLAQKYYGETKEQPVYCNCNRISNFNHMIQKEALMKKIARGIALIRACFLITTIVLLASSCTRIEDKMPLKHSTDETQALVASVESEPFNDRMSNDEINSHHLH